MTLSLLLTQIPPPHTQLSPSQHQNQDPCRDISNQDTPSLTFFHTDLVPRMGRVPLHLTAFAHAVPTSRNILSSLCLLVVPIHPSVSAHMFVGKPTLVTCYMFSHVALCFSPTPCVIMLPCLVSVCLSFFSGCKLHKARMSVCLLHRSSRKMYDTQQMFNEYVLNEQMNEDIFNPEITQPTEK